MEKQNGKSILITGANGGLALETVKLLAEDGFDYIIMACRTLSKATEARKQVLEMRKATTPITVQAYGGFDMNDPVQIAQAVNELSAERRLDVVFLAAGGVIFSDTYETKSWAGHTIEKTVFQNVIGAHLTLHHLKKNDLLQSNARIVVAGGEGARGIPGMIQKPLFSSAKALRNYVLADFDNLNYSPMNAIGVSKFMSALWVQKLAQLNCDMEVLWFSPGLTYGTNGLNAMPPVKRWIMKNIAFGAMGLLGLAQSPKSGARKNYNSLSGAIGKNGDILGAPEKKALGKITDQRPMNTSLTDQKLQDEFWNILEEVCGEF